MNGERLLFSFDHTPTQAEFELFARVSGDDNPIHVDADFSARTHFGRTVAHGMFIYTILWSRIRAALPGAQTLEQALKFTNPSYAGEPLRFEAFIAPGDAGDARIRATVSRLADGSVTCEAESRVDTGGQGV